MMKALMETKGE